MNGVSAEDSTERRDLEEVSARGHLTRLRNSPHRHLLLLLLDGAIAATSLWLALAIRFDGNAPDRYLVALPTLIALIVVARLLTSLTFRIHRWSYLLSGFSDGIRVVVGGVVGSALFVALVFFLDRDLVRGRLGPPRSVVILDFFIATALMGLVRFLPRLARLQSLDLRRARRSALRTLIVGAGATGEMLLRDLQRSDDHDYSIVGFVDDEPGTWGMMVGGRPVFGPISDLPELVRAHGVGKILIAIPRITAARIREIVALSAELGVQYKILPVSYVYLDQHVKATMLQDISPEDLLPRKPVILDISGSDLLRGRRAVVTGAAGSIGSEICVQLARLGYGSVVMVDLNENGLYLLGRRIERRFPGVEVALEVADIRDVGRIADLLSAAGPDDVFHAAAHKHVPLMELRPCEAIKNNVVGTLNVARAAMQASARRFVYISTDKAVRPSSVMGASKKVGEMVVRSLQGLSNTRFCAVRFGNVLGSAGSVVPLFREQIEAGGPVTVTHPDVRRYFMTTREAVGLVLKAAFSDAGDLYVLDMGEQIRILDLARLMIALAGKVPGVDVPIVFSGLRPGEKLSEQLLTEGEDVLPVADRIFVAKAPSPPADLDRWVGLLAEAASNEAGSTVVSLLQGLIPTYVGAVDRRLEIVHNDVDADTDIPRVV